ncbi:MAG: hypothetical protein ACK4PR_13380, partial [Gammaproteobacteria bacterium]
HESSQHFSKLRDSTMSNSVYENASYFLNLNAEQIKYLIDGRVKRLAEQQNLMAQAQMPRATMLAEFSLIKANQVSKTKSSVLAEDKYANPLP